MTLHRRLNEWEIKSTAIRDGDRILRMKTDLKLITVVTPNATDTQLYQLAEQAIVLIGWQLQPGLPQGLPLG